MNEPDYTHALHAQACQDAAKNRHTLDQHVLAMKGAIVYCARILRPFSMVGRPDCWTLETIWPERALITVSVRNVIACKHETCSCFPGSALSVDGGEV